MDERVLGALLIIVIVLVVFGLAIALTKIRAKDAVPEADWPTASATVHSVDVKHHRSGNPDSATAIVAYTTETGTTVTAEVALGTDQEKWPRENGSIQIRHHPLHRSTAEWVPPD